MAKSCTNCTGTRSIEDSVNKALNDQMHQRMQSGKWKRMERIRSSTVEPVLDTLINFTGMKQVYTKGIKLANKCMMLAQKPIKMPALMQKMKQMFHFSAVNLYTVQ